MAAVRGKPDSPDNFAEELLCLQRQVQVDKEFKVLAKKVEAACVQDKRDTLDNILRATTSYVHKELRDFTGPTKKRPIGDRVLPAVRLSNGELAATHGEAQERWLTQFAEEECAEVVEYLKSIQDAVDEQHCFFTGRVDQEVLPGVRSIASIYGRL